MNSKKPLYRVPVPSTAFTNVTLHDNVIRFEFRREGTARKGALIFDKVFATRTHAETCCTEWHIEGAYDTSVEVEGSDWVAQLQRDTATRQQRRGESWEMHHYMIYLDSAGCFEIIAESWAVYEPEPGAWNSEAY
jgi:hypothetical protein